MSCINSSQAASSYFASTLYIIEYCTDVMYQFITGCKLILCKNSVYYRQVNNVNEINLLNLVSNNGPFPSLYFPFQNARIQSQNGLACTKSKHCFCLIALLLVSTQQTSTVIWITGPNACPAITINIVFL